MKQTGRYTVSVLSLIAFSAYGSQLRAQTPSDIAITSNQVIELQPIGTAVGALSTVDTDTTASFTYSLVPGTGDVDNASFGIYLNKLTTGGVFNYTNQNQFSVRVRSTDQNGAFTEKGITVTLKHIPPILSNFREVVLSSATHTFAVTEFTNAAFVADGMAISKIQIQSLPSSGVLNLNGTAVVLNQEIAVADIPSLTYTADASFSGHVSFDWSAADTVSYAAVAAKVNITVKQPRTTPSGNGTTLGTVINGAGSGAPARGGATSSDNNIANAGSSHGVGSGVPRPSTPIAFKDDNNANTAGIEEQNSAPNVLIHNCYPNPFDNVATIKYQLPNDGFVQVKIYNAVGAEIKTLVSEQQVAGVHTAQFNGAGGTSLANGNYYYFILVKDVNGNQVSTNSGVLAKL